MREQAIENVSSATWKWDCVAPPTTHKKNKKTISKKKNTRHGLGVKSDMMDALEGIRTYCGGFNQKMSATTSRCGRCTCNRANFFTAAIKRQPTPRCWYVSSTANSDGRGRSQTSPNPTHWNVFIPAMHFVMVFSEWSNVP